MRYPSVAGTFYSSSRQSLATDIDSYLSKAESDPILVERKRSINQILGLVAPHAGHMYSGGVAAYAYALLKNTAPATYVIIGPNHTGKGKPIAISRDDWTTPLGVVKTDTTLCDAIKAESTLADFDESAHLFEHSIEVQLPFLQRVVDDPRIVAICMGIQSYAAANDIARAVADAAAKTRKNVVIIASSDFTHFESAESAKQKDERALRFIEKLHAKEFVDLVETENLSICGYGPIATALLWGTKNDCKVSLLKYANSGDVTSDYSEVVGYAAIAVYK
jgi:hypothetical protein